MRSDHVGRAAPVLLAWLAAACAGPVHARSGAAAGIEDWCPRPPPGSVVSQPREVKSHDGVLKMDLHIRSYRSPEGSVRYCYLSADAQSPTLRLPPGDLLELRLTNELTDLEPAPAAMPGMNMTPAGRGPDPQHSGADHAGRIDPCDSGAMTGTSTNLHFHGLTVPARCHEDEVLKTSVQPEDPPFEYRFHIPQNEPPGLYWYHPHIHGFSSRQVIGGASGALIIEGIERAVPQVAGLPERVLVIRDQDLLNPNAPPSKSEPVVPHNLIDRDGDSANNGTGFGRPAKDLSINFVPVPWPDYPPARIRLKPGARELWRVLNASAITYLNLALIYGRARVVRDAHRRHGPGRRERSQSRPGEHHRRPGCYGAPAPARLHSCATRTQPALAGRRAARAGTQTLLLGEAGEPERSQQCDHVLHHRGRPDTEGLRSGRRPEHRGAAG